jgi:HEAT repeat protein
MGVHSPTLFDVLTQLLHWPYWEVRMKAVQALGKLQGKIPDATIHRLFALHEDPDSRAVRQAASEALGKILQ